MAAPLTRMDAPPVRLGAQPIHVSPEGFKTYRGVAAFGDVVLEYPEDGRNEFAPTDEALSDEAVATLVNKPFTLHHPDELLAASDPVSVKTHVEGTVSAARADRTKSPPELVVDVVVWTAPAQQEIESGRVRDLSPGYMRDPEPAPAGAHYLGKPYQVVQRRRQYNHLSGVLVARGVAPDGRRARLDASSLPPGEVTDTLHVAFGDGRCLASIGDAAPVSVSPTPAAWLEALASARRLLVPADDLGALPPVAGRRRDGVVLPPSRALARWRHDSLAPAPAGHPSMSAPVHPYLPDMPSWRGWSEPADLAWVAYWPREQGATGLLWDQRAPDGAIVGAPMVLPPRPYAHDKHGEKMKDLLDTTPAEQPTRLDADPAAPAADPAAPAADPAAVALAAFSPEAVEILKTLPEADMAVLQQMALTTKGEAAEQAVVAAGEGAALEAGAEAEEMDRGQPGAAAAPALTMDMVNAAIADALAKAAKGAPSMDRAAAAPAVATPAVATAKPEPRTDAAIVESDRRFVDHVRSAGQRCDSVKTAGEAALALIVATSAKSVQDAARRAIKEDRREDLLALFDAADEARRGGHVRDQLAVLDAVHGGGGSQPATSHMTFPDGAV